MSPESLFGEEEWMENEDGKLMTDVLNTYEAFLCGELKSNFVNRFPNKNGNSNNNNNNYNNFKNNNSGGYELGRSERNEFLMWGGIFPFFRVSGKTLMPSKEDDGVQYAQPVRKTSSFSSMTSSTSSSGRNGKIEIVGNKAKIINSEANIKRTNNNNNNKYPVEEIIEMHGELVEIFAVDTGNDGGGIAKKGQEKNAKLLGAGHPPISPRMSIRTETRDLLFDVIWKNITPILAAALKNYEITARGGGKKNKMTSGQQPHPLRRQLLKVQEQKPSQQVMHNNDYHNQQEEEEGEEEEEDNNKKEQKRHNMAFINNHFRFPYRFSQHQGQQLPFNSMPSMSQVSKMQTTQPQPQPKSHHRHHHNRSTKEQQLEQIQQLQQIQNQKPQQQHLHLQQLQQIQYQQQEQQQQQSMKQWIEKEFNSGDNNNNDAIKSLSSHSSSRPVAIKNSLSMPICSESGRLSSTSQDSNSNNNNATSNHSWLIPIQSNHSSPSNNFKLVDSASSSSLPNQVSLPPLIITTFKPATAATAATAPRQTIAKKPK